MPEINSNYYYFDTKGIFFHDNKSFIRLESESLILFNQLEIFREKTHLSLNETYYV